MKKGCIFCGKSIISKSLEHVIPQWLIKHTGDPDRKVPIGIDWNTGKLIEYSFNALKFPACDSCNSNFSNLESRTKEIIIKILDEQPLLNEQFSILLGWFDKVRIGLWLGSLLLNKNIFGVAPNFYINSRIDIADRMLLIYKTSDRQKGIQFIGVGTPFFGYCPTCFGLVINQFYFINISTDFLFSRRLGLPYPPKKSLTDEGKIACDFVEGKKRILFPLIKKHFDKTCSEIYQPIIRPELIHEEIYNNDYVTNYFDIHFSSLGKILINYHNTVVDYSKVSGKQWIPEKVHERNILSKLVSKEVISFQDWLTDDMPSPDGLTLENKQRYKKTKELIKRTNKLFYQKIEEEL